MQKINFIVFLALLFSAIPVSSNAQKLPASSVTLEAMSKTNTYFMREWPDVGKRIVTNMSRASNIWTRAVYYEGLMAFYTINKKPEFIDYANQWANFHHWDLRDGDTFTRNADNQCAGQTYIDLYLLAPQPSKIEKITASIDSMMHTPKIDDWSWIDAIQMGMPIFAKLGLIKNDPRYWDRMHEMFMYTRDKHFGGLYNPADNLWWRDKDFRPPYKEPNGKDCYWSRGNGWVFAALVRVMDIIPKGAPHRHQYEEDFKAMADAIIKVQRKDGFWNASLHDPKNYGGKETTGTSMFVYGMAWGINNGYLEKKKYYPVVSKAWNALLKESVHPDGFLGYVQGTGKMPSDGQPVTYTSKPDFQDYGLGCFLLAGSEVYKLSDAK